VGQALYCIEAGLVVNRDVQVLCAGDTVWTPPDEEPWHDGTGRTFMRHVAMLGGSEDGDGPWLEPVPTGITAQPTRR
jgi:quercetin dioxygenase-like cupin family protein